MPLAEVIYDFYDRFKSVTQGYGSFDYDIIDYRESNLVLLDILVNGEKVDALSQIVHRERARARALQACERLKDEIPRQMFKIAIQGAIGGEIIARTTISAFRKDVTAKCYGGDITRKAKTSGKTKERQKTDEDDRFRQYPPKCFPGRAEVGYGLRACKYPVFISTFPFVIRGATTVISILSSQLMIYRSLLKFYLKNYRYTAEY